MLIYGIAKDQEGNDYYMVKNLSLIHICEIAKKIQDEMTYPGQVKITVIRETRAVSFAK